MKRKRISNLIILPLLSFILLLSFFIAPRNIQAQDDIYGVNDMDLYLDQNLQPREAAVGLINLALSFLGLIAVIIIIYGGFVWMTSGGEAEKVNKAKKILKNGLIGLIIVLLSWGIVTWLLAQFPGIFGGGNGDDDICNEDDTQSQFFCVDVNGLNCPETRHCLSDGTWGSWSNNCDCKDDDNGGQTGDSCDGQPLSSGCFPNDSMCGDEYYCSPNCTCQPKGSYGDPCDADTSTPTCDEPEDNLCGPYLTCDEEDCICLGPPVITSVSPMGGFCDNNVNTPCLSDDDCPETCNTDTPNGATDNFITILGHNFGNDEGEVLFNNSFSGNSPSSLNANCVDTWSNNQIIIAVPGGNVSGPITVNTADGRSDSTDNDDLGPYIKDFVSNTIIRPGLCLIDPDSGVLNDEITYQGINLLQTAEAYFGNYINNVKALEASLESPNDYSGTAKVPNINRGRTSTFALGTIARVSLYSNYLDFYKEKEPDPGPYINSFDPKEGAPGQYVTIYGGGFGNSKGNSKVYFGSVENEVNYNFPEVCLHSVWTNNKVIVKVPENIDNGSYLIKMDIGGEIINTSLLNPDQFEVDSSLSLAPSLCKISPIRGQAGVPVTLWGEYFGNISDSIMTIFHDNNIVEGYIYSEGSADYTISHVPSEAISGPIKLYRPYTTNFSNSLNFEIGPCETDADCGTQICCPVGTYKANRCEDSINDCSIDIANSVFEWSFSTELAEKDFCNEITELDKCLSESECCFDEKDNECVSTSNRLVFGENEEYTGYCKRWNCFENDLDNPCDFGNPLPEAEFINQNVCASECGDTDDGSPGVTCFNPEDDSCNFPDCSGNTFVFNCLMEDGSPGNFDEGDCGICCCDPNSEVDDCKIIEDVLNCQPNQDPCTGSNRGLCCGCSNDQDCGDGVILGCGYDTCCRSRPKVLKEKLIPPVDAENVCRNAIIKIPLDQRMNINTLTFNILLLEERDSDDFCPTGTFITKNIERDNKNFFARLFDNIKNSFNYIFKGSSKTALALPASDKLYCLVPGSIRVEQEAQRSVAYYQPSRLLRDENNYYIVVKGDEELNSETGVLSAWGIGMNGEGYNGVEGEDIEFNSVRFFNSFISKFTTMDDQEINSGVCEIDHVRISPSSYLFNTTKNDLNENDDDPNHETFDTVRDRDKVFMANAYTIDNQIIGPTDGYRWDWQWTIGNDDILEFLGTNPPLGDNQEFIAVKSHVTEANTYLEAKVDMDNYDNFAYIGDGKYAQADITVFICRNPWPAFVPHTNDWTPYYNNIYNYQLYYCRDDGSSVFADDLPALIYPPITSQQSSQLVCSTTNLPCDVSDGVNSPCGPNNEGYCVWSVLSESYFFRQARPSAGTILSVTPLAEGEKVEITLTVKPDLIYHENENLRGHLRVYYAQSGKNFSYDNVSLNYCNIVALDQNITCTYNVENLENNQLYRFRASAISRTNIETFFSNELTATPKDTTAPSKPSSCAGEIVYEKIINSDGEEEDVPIEVNFECEDLDDDVVRLRLYHGITAGNYGQYFEGQVEQFIFNFNIDYFNPATHHYAISAFDEAGNESEKSDNFSVLIPDPLND